MPPPPRQVSSGIVWHVWWQNCSVFAFITLLFWSIVAVSFIADYFGFEFRLKRGRSPITPPVALVMAGVVTGFALLLAVPRFFKGLRLAKIGEPIVGTVREKLGVTLQSLETSAVSYFVNDKPYRIKAGLGSENSAIGTKIPLIYDPTRPQRCLPRDLVFPLDDDVNVS